MKLTDLKSYKVVGQAKKPIAENAENREGVGGVKGVSVGIAKSELGLLRGMGEIGQDLAQHTVGHGVRYLTKKITGRDVNVEDIHAGSDLMDLYDPESKLGSQAKDVLVAQGGAEKFGKFIGDAVPLALGGGVATKAAQGASLLTQVGAQAVAAGAVTSAQEGEIGKKAAISAGTAGALTLAAPIVGTLWRKATQDLPEWIVKPLVKQAKAQKVAGKANAEKILLETGRIGSVDNILSKTDDAISQLDDQITKQLDVATESGKTINLSTIRQSVVDKVNLAGGEIDDDGVKSIIENIAPQAKGLLKKEVLTPKDANRLRQAIDRTLGDRAFFASQLPYNKDIAMDFVGALRNTVKDNAPEGTRALYSELSKNIELRKALLSRAMESGGPNRIGLMDLITGMAGLTRDPLTAVGMIAGRRALESGVAKTASAQLLTQLGKAGPILAKMQPAEQAIVLSFLQNVLAENSQYDRQQTEGQ